jgi:hypothetical protein
LKKQIEASGWCVPKQSVAGVALIGMTLTTAHFPTEFRR